MHCREDFKKGLELKAGAANLRMETIATYSSYYPDYQMVRVGAGIVIIV